MCAKLRVLTLIVLMLAVPVCQGADGALTPNGVLNYVADAFIAGAKSYSEPIKSAAERLFWLLLGISIVVSGIRLVLRQGDITAFFAIFVKLVILTGIFYFLLSNGSKIGSSIVDSLSSITNTRNIGPSELLDVTFNIGHGLNRAVSKSFSGMAASLVIQLMILIFNIVMFLVTIRYVVLYLTAYIFCICGVFVLGFGAFGYTREIAVNFLRIIFSLSLELMTMILVCNTGFTVLEEMGTAITKLTRSITLQDTGVVLFTALFMHVISATLPKIVGSLVMRTPGTGGLSFTVPGVPNIFRRTS